MIFIISTGVLGLATLILSIILFKTKQAQKLSEEEIDRDIIRVEKILNNIILRMKSK